MLLGTARNTIVPSSSRIYSSLAFFRVLALILNIIIITPIMIIMNSSTNGTADALASQTISSSNNNNNNSDDLTLILKKTFPHMKTYESKVTISQANAEGQRLVLTLHEDEEPFDHEVFLKRVVASDYITTKKDWSDLRRTLLYMRTEIRFYQETIPLLKQQQQQQQGSGHDFNAAPNIYLAQHTFDEEGWLPDNESGIAAPATSSPPAIYQKYQNKEITLQDVKGSGEIIMDCVHEDQYFQTSPISIEQAKQCLSAVAQLHAAAWEDRNLLEHCSNRLSLGSYHLEVRNPKELATIAESWDHFATQFADNLQEAGLTERTKGLGKRLQNVAKTISQQLSPHYNDPYATLAHGDYKAMNVFLPKKEELPTLMVDYASTGIGLGMSDVAMHIHHAVLSKDLANDGEEILVDHYLQELHKLLLRKEKSYPRDVAFRHYRMAVVDYGRFVMGRFWKTATPETFEKRKDSPNTTLINRNVDAAMAFLDRMEKYVTDFEQQQQQQKEAEL